MDYDSTFFKKQQIFDSVAVFLYSNKRKVLTSSFL